MCIYIVCVCVNIEYQHHYQFSSFTQWYRRILLDTSRERNHFIIFGLPLTFYYGYVCACACVCGCFYTFLLLAILPHSLLHSFLLHTPSDLLSSHALKSALFSIFPICFCFLFRSLSANATSISDR